MEVIRTLVTLAAEKAISDYRSLRDNAPFLPKAVLESLLASSIRHRKILALRELLCQWPFKQLFLQEIGNDFEEHHAVLFAFTLQKANNKVEIIDLRGCRTGFHGTSAFCKLALGFPVSQSDVSEMTVIDNRVLNQVEQNTQYLTSRKPPVTVILDCFVNVDNYQIMKQALVKHSILDIKACSMKLVELGRKKVCSLVSFVEPDIITTLDVSMNSLEGEGILLLSDHIKNFRNLNSLNLSYNCLTHNDTEAIKSLAGAFEHLLQLQRLVLTENNLGRGVVTLLQSLQCPLTHLTISGCGVKTEELTSLGSIQTLQQLEHLELSTNALVHCVSAMSKFICKSKRTLKYLQIEDNMFVTSSVGTLSSMAKKMKKLEVLSICYNHLLSDDVQTIQNAIPHVKVINRDWLF